MTSELRERRNKLGLTAEALALMAGVSAATIYRLERGENTPHTLTAAALDRALTDAENAKGPEDAAERQASGPRRRESSNGSQGSDRDAVEHAAPVGGPSGGRRG